MRFARWAARLSVVLILGWPLPTRADDDELFKNLDKNGDGQLTQDELGAEQLRLFERLVRAGDKDGDGKLNRAEFVAALKERPVVNPAGKPGGAEGRPAPREIFQRFDANGDGKLSKDEAPDRMKQNFERLDRDSDGLITLEELAQGLAALARLEAGKPDNKPAATNRKPDGAAERKPQDKPLEASRQPDATDPRGRGGPLLLAALDTDHDGELSAEEIAAAPKSLVTLDKNGDGKLSRDELFANLAADGRPGNATVRELLARLRQADANGDGKISREEAPERLKQFFDRVDANGDGQLDPDELRSVLERLANERP